MEGKYASKGSKRQQRNWPPKKALDFASQKMSVSAVTASDPFEDAKKMFESIFR